MQSLEINLLPAVSESVNADGFGTVRFGNVSVFAGLYENTGLEFMAYSRIRIPPSFYDIQDAHQVFRLVNALRSEAGSTRDETENSW